MTLLGLGLALFGPFGLALAGERRGGRPGLYESLAGEAVYAAIVGAVLWIAVAHAGLSLETLGLRPLRWQSLAWGAALLVFFQRIYGPALFAVMRRLGVRGFEGGLAKMEDLPLWYLTLAVVIGGSAEEILYRGYAIAQLEQLGAASWLAALLPLVVFAFAHVPLWGVAPAVSTFFAGGVFTLFYLWQRDLAPNIIAHVATDFVGIVLWTRARSTQKAS